MRTAALLFPALLLTACASVDTTPSAALIAGAPGDLTFSEGLRAKARFRVDAPAVRAARTLRIEPSLFGTGLAENVTDRQRDVVAQTLNQSLCRELSRRFKIVAPDAPADLVVRAQITRVEATGAGVAAVSALGGLASPIPFTPRLPVGLGSLVAEGSARDAQGAPKAVIVWGRGADMFTTNARASSIGDAFTLARAFSKDFAKLLIRGGDPFRSTADAPRRPRRKPAASECAAWGASPGAAGFISGQLGLPPEITAPQPAPAVSAPKAE
jgi:hypothetical protein